MDNSSIRPSDYLVLVCDDEDSIRGILADALSQWGFQVVTAPNGEAAMEYFKTDTIPHIVVTDIRMGGMTGIDLARKVKEMSDEIEVVIMTSHGSFDTAVQAMRLGVYDYLSKPFENIEDVRSVLLHVCERIYLRLYSEYLVAELQRKNQEIEALALMSTKLAQNLDLAKTIDIACEGLYTAFGNCPVVFFQYLPAQNSLRATARFPKEVFAGTQAQFLVPTAQPSSAGVVEYFKNICQDADFSAVLQSAAALDESGKDFDTQAWKAAELVTREIPRGVFVLLKPTWVDDVSDELLRRYLQTIATSFENSLLHNRVVEISVRDGLTGLNNVRFFRERFQQELALAARLQHPVSLIFFDVDHFKKYNDANGHPAGDQVLKTIGQLMQRTFRKTDVTARYGGEEFVALLTHTAFVDALEKAESFRKLVEETPFPFGETQPLGKVTVSIGVAEFPSHGETVENVIKAADDALYAAKKRSRNVVVPGIAIEGYIPSFSSISLRSRSQK